MTIIKKIVITAAFMSFAFGTVDLAPTNASEVTGTLSSGASTPTSNSSSNGTITGGVGSTESVDGTVSGSVVSSSDNNSSGGGSSSSGGSRRRNNSSLPPTVLGAATGPVTVLAGAPAFPNTGFGPGDTGTPWNLTLIGIALGAIAWLYIPRKNQRKV